jgi:hypothetical protein
MLWQSDLHSTFDQQSVLYSVAHSVTTVVYKGTRGLEVDHPPHGIITYSKLALVQRSNCLTMSTSWEGHNVLPISYLWPEESRPSLQHDEYSEDADSVPIIDLACYRNGDAAAKQKLLSQVREACVDWGFFQIVNHNFSLELVERVRSQALKLFTLPLETKRTVEKSPGEFTGFGHATVKAGDVQPWSEGFYLNSVSKVDEVARTLWPQGYNSDFV